MIVVDSQQITALCPCGGKHGAVSGSFEAAADKERKILVRKRSSGSVAATYAVLRDRDRFGQHVEIVLRPVAQERAEPSSTSPSLETEMKDGRSGELKVEWKGTGDLQQENSGLLREALILRAVQCARRRGATAVEFTPFLPNITSKESVKDLAIWAFTHLSGLAPFKIWVEEDPDMWDVCLQLANAYWTRSQIEVLVSEPFRELTVELMAGHLKPTYPTFPSELLTVEYLSFWELAGCLGSWAADATAEDLEIKREGATERFAEHILRSSMSRRLQGTVLSK